MLPISNTSSPQSPENILNKPKSRPYFRSSSPSSADVVLFKSYFLSPLSRHPLSCLILSILFLQLLILTFSHFLPSSLSFSHRCLPVAPSPNPKSENNKQLPNCAGRSGCKNRTPGSTTVSYSSSAVPAPNPSNPKSENNEEQLQKNPPITKSKPEKNKQLPKKSLKANLKSENNIQLPKCSTGSQAVGCNSLTHADDSLSEYKKQCEFGKFYVYNLPSEFNTDIYRNCDKLSPWGSRCIALSNGGFGRKAVGIERIIPANLSHAWYWTDQFASEIIFHNRMLNHKCRTESPESAMAYYIPFYAGLAVGKYLWHGYTVRERDQQCEKMLDWVHQEMSFFNRSNGWDHFLTMGRITWDFRRTNDHDWGSRCIIMRLMRNITRLLIERNQYDYFDVGVPYPTGFHPSTESDVVSWQNFVLSRDRHTLFSFAGASRRTYPNDFRAVLLSQCRNSSGSCRVVNCTGTRCVNGTSEILETFLDSDFCLQPRGDSFTRRSIFDCMIAGSIPVFFWRRSAYVQYQWFLPDEPESYSVFIHRNEVKNGTTVKSVHERFTKEEVRKMREKVVEFIPKFIYAKPKEGLGTVKDAVDLAVDGVLRRVKDQKEKGYSW